MMTMTDQTASALLDDPAVLILNRKYFRDRADCDGFIYKTQSERPVLHISDNGTITRADIRLDLCRSMTLKEATKALRS